MKCKVCRARAAVEVRRHNAAFCPDHFLEHCRKQVARTVKEFRMFGPHERVLVCISGGKDSLALWDILLEEGYAADGLYADLGIGGYSERSKETAAGFASSRGATLHVRSFQEEYGFTTPSLAVLTRRVPCAGCGMAKRYTFNRMALELGYDVCATGHNLDDEASTLLANVLHWNVSALSRQMPALPAGPGFARKVKPLVRLAERDTAAYAVLRGIDYVVEECPLVAGNTLNRHKESLAAVEEQSPGSKHAFYFGFLDRAAALFRQREAAALGLRPCRECGQPTTTETCVLCRTRLTAAERAGRLEGKSADEVLALARSLSKSVR